NIRLGQFCVSPPRCHKCARPRTRSIVVLGGRVASSHSAELSVLSQRKPWLSPPHVRCLTSIFLKRLQRPLLLSLHLLTPTFLTLTLRPTRIAQNNLIDHRSDIAFTLAPARQAATVCLPRTSQVLEAVRERPGLIVTLRQKTRLLADSRQKN